MITYEIPGLTTAEHAEFFGPDWYDDDDEEEGSPMPVNPQERAQRLQQLRDRTTALLTNGYSTVAPPEVFDGDASMVATWGCECGHIGMDYLPHYKRYHGQAVYCPIAKCPACGDWFEF